MRKSTIIFLGVIAADVAINIFSCIRGKKDAERDIALTDALLANRDAVINRNELLELEVKSLKTLVEMISQKDDREKEAKKNG